MERRTCNQNNNSIRLKDYDYSQSGMYFVTICAHVGAIVRGYKSAVTKQIGYSVWQRNYHEHIIRNEKSYQYIANYIVNNPANWGKNEFYTA